MTNDLSVSQMDFTKKYQEIQAMQEQVAGQIQKAKNDYADDGLFNDADIKASSMTLEQVNDMKYEDVVKLLQTETPSAVAAELAVQQKNLDNLMKTFADLQADIETLDKVAKAKEKEYNEAVRRQSKMQAAKEQADADVQTAQEAYTGAQVDYAAMVSKERNEAYEEALSEYLKESSKADASKNKDEQKAQDKVDFSAILSEKLRGINASDSGVADAKQNLANAQSLADKCQTQLNKENTMVEFALGEWQTAISNYNAKEAELNQVSTQLNTVENKTIPELQVRMANATFVEENKVAIDNIAYEKNPETIQARADVNAAGLAIQEETQKAIDARNAAINATNAGDLEKAKAEQQKAEAAKQAAEEAQRRAQEAAAKLRDTDQTKINTTSVNTQNMATLGSSIEDINNAIKDYENMIKANREAAPAREAAGVRFATEIDSVTGETTKNLNQLDLTKMISAAELALVKANNIDLTEVVEINGQYYPKYIIAQGKSDKKYHIYERDGKSTKSMTTLARKYAKGGGYDIVKSGNGYMSISSDSDTAKSGYCECFWLDCCNSDLSSCHFGTTYKKYSTSSPLSFDLNGDGVKTSSNVVDFDIDGDGQMDKINDSADAVLVFDKDHDGISGKDASECFGNNTDLDGDGKADGYKDGFEALKALALKENLINNDDDMKLDANDLKFLEATYGLKLKANGYNSEAQSLADLGITEINLASTDKTTMTDDFDGMGNQLMTQEGATFVQNGVVKEYADIWHQKKPFLNLTAA